jgi:hypothetical protein
MTYARSVWKINRSVENSGDFSPRSRASRLAPVDRLSGSWVIVCEALMGVVDLIVSRGLRAQVMDGERFG